jgi:hypothetical protein
VEAFKQKMKENENADKSDSSDNTEIDESSSAEKSTLLPTSASIHDPISTILGNSEVRESYSAVKFRIIKRDKVIIQNLISSHFKQTTQ